MENFDYKKYLKTNPLLEVEEEGEGEDEEESSKQEIKYIDTLLSKQQSKLDMIMSNDHKVEFLNMIMKKIPGKVPANAILFLKAIKQYKVGGDQGGVNEDGNEFEDYEGPSIEDVASEEANIEDWTPSDQEDEDLFEKKITKSQLKEAIKRIINEKISS